MLPAWGRRKAHEISRRDVVQLLDLARGLDRGQVAEVIDLVKRMRAPRGRRFVPDALADVPLDDEPVTDAERAAIAAAMDDDPRGRLTAAEARRRWC